MSTKQSQPRSRSNPALCAPGFFGVLVMGASVGVFSLAELGWLVLPGQGLRLLLLLAGGLLLLSGIAELKRQNGFGSLIGLGYGFYWLALSAFLYVPHGPERSSNPHLLASYIVMWGLFTSILFLGTLLQQRLLRVAIIALALFQFAFGAALLNGTPLLQQLACYTGLGSAVLLLLCSVVLLACELRQRFPGEFALGAQKP